MRPVTLTTLVHYTSEPRSARMRPEPISVESARRCIRRNRKNADTVNVYETTDRNGESVHVVHAHYGPGHWDNTHFVTDIYEIPTDTLTEL